MSQPPAISSDQLRRAVRQRLEMFRHAGVRYLSQSLALSVDSSTVGTSLADAGDLQAESSQVVPPTEPEMNPPSTSRRSSSAPQPASEQVQLDKTAADGGLSPPERIAQLDLLRSEVAACHRCQELADTRTQTVFGVGNPQARLVFCGEAPGADEDRQGEPFVGRAGQLLTKIIEACSLRREDVYILNVLKCRPPNNRNPLATEVTHCRGYLDRQLEIIRPEYICCLGTIAAQTLLETTTPIGKLRGEFHDYHGIPVWCTYHPAYLLRNPPAKRHVWDDLQVLMAKMGIDVNAAAK